MTTLCLEVDPNLSQQLGISRNTVSIVYEKLVEDGYLISRPRSGYYLHPDYNDPHLTLTPSLIALTENSKNKLAAPNWHKRINQRDCRKTRFRSISTPLVLIYLLSQSSS